MREFGNRRGGSGGGFRRRPFGGPREMHKAVCSDCGKECEVPFRPAQDRPVFCKDCFMKRKDGGGPGTEQRKHREEPREELDEQLEEVAEDTAEEETAEEPVEEEPDAPAEEEPDAPAEEEPEEE